MRLAEVVDASSKVAATRSRTQKTTILADLLGAADPSEVPLVVAWLSGEIPQGRLGVGWRSLGSVGAEPGEQSTLDVAAVDAAFAELATTSGPGSVGRRAEILSELFGAATESEQRFLFMLIGGELRQGALAGVMTEAIARASGVRSAPVRRAYMLTGSLGETAGLAIDGGESALGAIRLRVGRAISPMLATPADGIEKAWADLGPAAVVEYKLDGARIQVHRDGDDIKVFTRTLRDITAQTPDIVATIGELDCRTAIFDGETLMLDDSGRPRAFQDTMSRFSSTAVAGADHDAARILRPYLFDCLHLDGEDFIDRPLRDRLAALDVVAPHLRIPSVRDTDLDSARAQAESALAAGHEGVMVKALDSSYAAGRRGKAWQKVKPVHSVDLVVLAVEWGSGRRAGKLSNIHLGARGPDGPVMVGKTFKGMTDETLAWQTEEFPKHETHRDDYTVYLRPEIVVEIELDGVQRSSRYPGGVALRFARVVRYRPDKDPGDIESIEQLRALVK